MAATIAANGQFEQRTVEIGSATATSTDTETLVATIDARGYSTIAVTSKNAGSQSVTYHLYGCNDPSFADEVAQASSINYKTAALASGLISLIYTGVGGITTAGTPIFAFYRIKLINTTTGAGHASATTFYWCLKNT